MVNLHRRWMLLALAKKREPMQVLVKSVRRTFLPLQKLMQFEDQMMRESDRILSD
jgi:hypothetical protein